MILRGLKEKSNKKYINSTLRKRVVSNSSNKIQQLGILINSDEDIDYAWFNTLAAALNINENKVEIIAFTSNIKEEDYDFSPTYNPKHLGWKGSLKHVDLKRFTQTDFDLLISYYTEDSIALKLLTAASKAKFKVGILQEDERLNDLIIKTERNDFDTFKSELLKYLNILNKI